MPTSLERAVNKACATLDANGIPRHRHSRRCINILKHVLYKGEETVLEARQSTFRSLTPTRVVATVKRVIIVRPSFWGLYTGRDIFSSSNYIIIPYKYITGVSLSRGLVFSSIKIHTHSGVDPSSMMHGEEEVNGIDATTTVNLARFIEEIIEYEELGEAEHQIQAISHPSKSAQSAEIELASAKSLVLSGKAKFVWLGIEPLEEVSAILGVDQSKMLKVSGSHLLEYSKTDLENMHTLILISYNEVLCDHTARMLKKKIGIDALVLKGGIREAASRLDKYASDFL